MSEIIMMNSSEAYQNASAWMLIPLGLRWMGHGFLCSELEEYCHWIRRPHGRLLYAVKIRDCSELRMYGDSFHSEDLSDLRDKLNKITVAFDKSGKPITTDDLDVGGAMTAWMRNTINPTLMSTAEYQPVWCMRDLLLI